VCRWTNEYQEASRSRKRRESHERKWHDLTVENLKAYLGMLLLMPMIHKPKLRDYWSNSVLTDAPAIKTIFSRDEFFQIKSAVKFYDTKNFNQNDRLSRMRPLMNSIISNTSRLYAPPRDLTLDETMIKFSGRSNFKVYMPLKPIKYGFKVFTVTPSEEPIVVNFSIFDGKRSNIREIVQNMMSPFLNKGHHLYIDRFYCSPSVLIDLQRNKTGACGTCMLNRLSLSEEIKTELSELPRDDFKYYATNEILLSAWKDKKLVTVISTIHKPKQNRIIRRRKQENITNSNSFIKESKNVPNSICEYNLKAKGVDILDQYISYYLFSHKSIKWHFRVLIYLLEIALVNSWTIYSNHSIQRERPANEIMNFEKFKRSVAKFMIEDKIRASAIPTTPTKTKRTHVDSNIELWNDCHLDKSEKKRKCYLCKERQSNYCCGECDLTICLIPCYDLHRLERSKSSKMTKSI
jgi:hypothetical protein